VEKNWKICTQATFIDGKEERRVYWRNESRWGEKRAHIAAAISTEIESGTIPDRQRAEKKDTRQIGLSRLTRTHRTCVRLPSSRRSKAHRMPVQSNNINYSVRHCASISKRIRRARQALRISVWSWFKIDSAWNIRFAICRFPMMRWWLECWLR